MFEYWLSCVCSILVFSFTKNIKLCENSKIFLSAIPIIIVSGFRYGVGTDYIAYIKIFYEISNGEGDYIEPGYYLINKICQTFGFDGKSVIFVCGALFALFVLKILLRDSECPEFGIFLLFGTTIYFFN